jgi:hypothetical protein
LSLWSELNWHVVLWMILFTLFFFKFVKNSKGEKYWTGWVHNPGHKFFWMVEYKFKKKKFQPSWGFFIKIHFLMVLCIFNFWICFFKVEYKFKWKQLLNLIEFMVRVTYLIFLRFKEKNIEPGWLHELSYGS